MIYVVLGATLLMLGGAAALGFRFARLLEPRQRKVLYLLVLLGAAGVGIQMAHGFMTSYRWAQQHQHHHHR